MKCKYCKNKINWFWHWIFFVHECDACETGIKHFEQGRSNYDPRTQKQQEKMCSKHGKDIELECIECEFK